MAKITYTDKDKTGVVPVNKWRDADANEVKESVNALYDAGYVPYSGADDDVDLGENSITAKDIIGEGVIVSTGTTGTTPVSGAGTRLMWIPEKAAFRAGIVNSDQWDDANIGDYSFAAGYRPTASGENSIAMGRKAIASGDYSTAIGEETTASGEDASAMGFGTKAESYVTTAIGQFNVGGGSPTTVVATDPIFEIGIGTSNEARANAVTVLKNGDAIFKKIRIAELNTAPSSASDTGTLGEIRFDDTYMYLCVATNTWKRTLLETW